jgi:hypothetical protein
VTTVTDSLVQLARHIEKAGFKGFNTGHFLAAAAELGVPWRRLRGQLVQLGQGANARWLESSWTDRTSAIGSGLARNKQAGAALLRINGLPVPDHHLVETADEALRQAQALGYPVVVKPVDRDGGEGVRAGLEDAAAVRAAFDEALKLSARVLVEKHVPGRDYRLQVVDGEVQGVLERVPGGVVGNGRDSVRVLLEQQNHDRRTALDDRRYLYAMDFDDEAVKLLSSPGPDRGFGSFGGAGRQAAQRVERGQRWRSGGTDAGPGARRQPAPGGARCACAAAGRGRHRPAGARHRPLVAGNRRQHLRSQCHAADVHHHAQAHAAQPVQGRQRTHSGGARDRRCASRPGGGRADPSTAAAPWPGRRAGPRQRDVGGCAHGGRPVWPAAWWVRACWCWTRRCRPWSWP